MEWRMGSHHWANRIAGRSDVVAAQTAWSSEHSGMKGHIDKTEAPANDALCLTAMAALCEGCRDMGQMPDKSMTRIPIWQDR